MSKQQTFDSKFIETKVKCKICSREFEMITYSHLKIHGITFDEYQKKFPDAVMMSEATRQKMREGVSGEKNGMFGKHQSEESNQKNREANLGEKNGNYGKKHPGMNLCEKNGMFGKGYLITGEKNGFYGKHQTEEVKQSISEAHLGKPKTELHKQLISKAVSKSRKEFFATEEGQKWLDENWRDENSPTWNGGRAAAEMRHRGFGFIPINKNFIGAEGHHLDKHFVLYIPKELHHSVPHNVMTGKNMKKINDLAIRFVYGEHPESRWSID